MDFKLGRYRHRQCFNSRQLKTEMLMLDGLFGHRKVGITIEDLPRTRASIPDAESSRISNLCAYLTAAAKRGRATVTIEEIALETGNELPECFRIMALAVVSERVRFYTRPEAGETAESIDSEESLRLVLETASERVCQHMSDTVEYCPEWLGHMLLGLGMRRTIEPQEVGQIESDEMRATALMQIPVDTRLQ